MCICVSCPDECATTDCDASEISLTPADGIDEGESVTVTCTSRCSIPQRVTVYQNPRESDAIEVDTTAPGGGSVNVTLMRANNRDTFYCDVDGQENARSSEETVSVYCK